MGEEYGLAFGANKNAMHTSRHGNKFPQKPPRFDPLVDFKKSKLPGPTSYSPTDSTRKR